MGYPSTVDIGGPTPLALPYWGDLNAGGNSAGGSNTVYLIGVTLPGPAVLTSVRVRFGTGGSGHYDTGIYDATGTNGSAGNLLAHAASTNTSLATATGVQTPAFISNVTLSPGRYWLALWIDNATDTINRVNGTSSGIITQSFSSSGPLPSSASSPANTGFTPVLIGIVQGGWS